jgi:outer membrane protein TolC
MAIMEVRRAGSAEQLAQARAVLTQARKSLYLILAEDESAAADTDTVPSDTVPSDTVPSDTAPSDGPDAGPQEEGTAEDGGE